MLLPMPIWPLWLAHLAVLEASLLVTIVGLLAASLSRGRLRALSALAAGIGLLPFAAIAPSFIAARARFSLAEYALGFSGPDVLVQRDVDLGSAGLRVDLYRPAAHVAHRLVVIVHGGSWQRGDKGEAPHLSRALAGAGYVVADVPYRLAPRDRFPAAVADVKCLVGRLRERAAQLDVDPVRLSLLGRSAGGQIALVAAYSTSDARLPPACAVAEGPVRAVVSLYAPTDLAWGHDHPLVPDPIDGPASIEAYLGGAPSETSEAYHLATAGSWSDRPTPPTLLIHGAGDRLVGVEHALRLASALRDAGRPVELLIIPMADHGFDQRCGGLGEQLARHAILEFLERFAS
jgi:acetyl esterase/lipase